MNRGEKICLRLRYPGDANQFLPMEQVVNTMLHELSHNVFGPHDAKFHALWNQLREEHEGLIRKGYTGEGFLSEGRRLGGRPVPRDEARRIARAAAEKRRTLSSGSGQKLGGAPLRVGQDIRQVIVGAIESRNRITKGCGASSHNDAEIKQIADQATINGFRTKAEEDKANEDAIAQALWELVQADEKAKYGDDYVEITASNPVGNGGGTSFAGEVDSKPLSSLPNKRVKNESKAPAQSPTSSSLVSQGSPNSGAKASASLTTLSSNNPFRPLAPEARTSSSTNNSNTPADNPFYELKGEPERWKGPFKWICPICTCHNPESFLCCDACSTERPSAQAREYVYEDGTKPRSPSKPSKPAPKMWTCHACGKRMEEQWWTCSGCETMKLSS